MSDKIPKMFSIRELAKESEVSYSKIYHNSVGTYNSLTDQERTLIFNAAYKDFEKLALYLGFTVDGKRVKKT